MQRELDGMVDYDELTRRAFGQPCPASLPACTNDWDGLTHRREEARSPCFSSSSFRRTTRTTWRRRSTTTSPTRGEKIDAGDTKIRTEAKSKTKPRDPVVQIDYVVREANGKLAVVDIVTEGSSLTKNYYDQFDRKLKDPALGYSNIVQKLKEKIATL